ncbi:MAG: SlyX family protein [Lentisphaeria bacterium]|nr:SlyX family protein [Lentisphaeria bacterium]
MQDPVVGLEIKLTFQEQLVDELNQIVIDQQRQIDKLTEKLTLLEGKIETGGGGNEVTNPRPPHH